MYLKKYILNQIKVTKVFKALGVFGVALLMAGCTEESIVPDEPNNGGSEETTYLSFSLNVPMMTRADNGTSDFEAHESDVTGLQVLFYNNDGNDENYNKLLGSCPTSNIFFVKGQTVDSDATYNVKLEVTESLADILRTKPFKIAVLANWSASSGVSDINDLHYQADVITSTRADYFLSKEGKRGVYSEWAKPQITEASFKNDPDQWIKLNWTTKHFGDYTGLWKDWNNDNCFGLWFEDTDNTEFETNGLHFKKEDNTSITDEGINLPKVSEPSSLRDTNVLSFVASASGSLYITTNPSEAPQLSVKLYNITSGRQSVKYNSTTNGVQKFDIDLPADSQRVFIYNTGDDNVTISKIEYVQGAYLAKTQYQGETPDNQPIPMYGVKAIAALTDWAKGTSYEISNFDDITGKVSNTVHLLRSVAKLVLYLPKSFNAHHVYLRDANMTAYNETNDVSSETLSIWPVDHADHTGTSPYDGCEWYHIQGHKPFWNNTTGYSGTYQEDLAWYYGTWADNGSIGDVTVPAKEYCNGSDGKTHPEYPRVMNPRIARTDFVEFIKTTGDTESVKDRNDVDCDRYVLYVCDQFTDDPSDLTDLNNAVPKVPHIEFRVNNEIYNDPWDNLDDDNCYRIYFTPGGIAEGAEYPTFSMKTSGTTSYYDNWENSYENKAEYLVQHWPIIRNHVYDINVEEVKERKLAVQIKVLAWARRDIHVAW